MRWLLPDVVRALMPSCPPVAAIRVMAFVVVAAAAVVLLGRDVSPHEVLVMLGGIGMVTMMLTRSTGIGSLLASLVRAVAVALSGRLASGIRLP